MWRLRQLPIFLILFPPLLNAAELRGKVVSIQDGDTLTILSGQNQVKIRLYGVDCPEKHQAYGSKAHEFTGSLSFGKEIRVVQRSKDQYGRIVGVVVLPDGRVLNEELLKGGLAWWYYRYSAEESYQALETDAKRGRRGLWSDPEPVAPWDFRRGKTALQEVQ